MLARFRLFRLFLTVAFLVAVAGLVLAWGHDALSGRACLELWCALSVIGGTATVGYINPTAVAPTAVGMLPLSRVVATVAFGDSDTTATITHSMNLPLNSVFQQGLGIVHGQTSGNPIISWIFASSSAGTVLPIIQFTRATNTVTVTKSTGTGTNCTIEVQLNRTEPTL